MSDGSKKPLKTLEIGDKVQTLSKEGKVTNTEFIMMMDVSDHESKLLSNVFTFFVRISRKILALFSS